MNTQYKTKEGKCVWCGKTYEEHEDKLGIAVPKMGCTGIKSGFYSNLNEDLIKQTKEVKADWENDYNLDLIRLLEKYIVVPNTDLSNGAVISTILNLVNKNIKKNFVAKSDLKEIEKNAYDKGKEETLKVRNVILDLYKEKFGVMLPNELAELALEEVKKNFVAKGEVRNEVKNVWLCIKGLIEEDISTNKIYRLVNQQLKSLE